jgi:hypothetical protein
MIREDVGDEFSQNNHGALLSERGAHASISKFFMTSTSSMVERERNLSMRMLDTIEKTKQMDLI